MRARGWARSPIVLRATFSPAAALLQLLVVRLLAAFFVLHICGATSHCWPHAAVLAAGLCWCLDVMDCDCSIVMSLRDPVQLDHRARLRLQVGGPPAHRQCLLDLRRYSAAVLFGARRGVAGGGGGAPCGLGPNASSRPAVSASCPATGARANAPPPPRGGTPAPPAHPAPPPALPRRAQRRRPRFHQPYLLLLRCRPLLLLRRCQDARARARPPGPSSGGMPLTKRAANHHSSSATAPRAAPRHSRCRRPAPRAATPSPSPRRAHPRPYARQPAAAAPRPGRSAASPRAPAPPPSRPQGTRR